MKKQESRLSRGELDSLCINTIRFLSIDAVEKANSGHPGMPMGAAPMGYVLWDRHLKHNPANPRWFDRDRFVLSAGHGSMLLYSLLYLTGYDLSIEEIQMFRQWGSKTPGHPERDLATGVETTTGPLGQGFGNAVGMAIAEAHIAAHYNRPGFRIIDHYTYGIVSDGDLMEGVSSEAASLAGHLELGKLILLYDNNHVSLSAGTPITFTEDRARRFEAYGWHTISIEDGNDIESIERALRAARGEKKRPSLILVNTHIGYGSPHKQDSFEAHGSPLGKEEVNLTKEKFGWPLTPLFHVPPQAIEHCRRAVERGADAEDEWKNRLCAYAGKYPECARDLERIMAGALPAGWDLDIPSFPPSAKGTKTRVASGQVMNAIAPRLPEMIGGSADLDPSTHTVLKKMGDFESPYEKGWKTEGAADGDWSYIGDNIHFGVREHAMGSILNGMSVHGGTIPYGATFLIFSDYMRPPIRLAAIMGTGVIYVFTHDSIGLGEDGTTHQPVEQLASLRAMPGIVVIRPCDANETAVAWRVAIETRDHPVALILTRQDVPTLDRSVYAPADGLRKGAYVLADAPAGAPDLVMIATGSEVSLIVAARDELQKEGVQARIVSMPSWELFEAQSRGYRDSVLPPHIRSRLAVEAGATQGWCRYVGDAGDVIGVDRFGASAPAEVMMEKYGFTVENVCARARALLEKGRG
ncbi:MAG: transketolase [Candidatus Aureabacteria bacterium]|nr:transketolase [Candidatus Auribacterota bacterium]